VIVVIGAPPKGLLGRLTGSSASVAPSAESVTSALFRSGWQRVRPIGDRDGVGFVEGFAP
jgi:hypothetical protein